MAWQKCDLNAIKNALARLDPVRDARRYAQLTFETRYGLPIFIHALFSVAFAYNMGDPRIARVLYREGTGSIVRQTRQRNFETLVFFGLIYQHGDSAEGQRIIARMQQIHRHFHIPNELYLYTLATLAVLPRRLSERLASPSGIDPGALEAQFHLWRRVGGLMGITGIPQTQEAYLDWMLNHEKKHFSHTADAQAVVQALSSEWASHWFPKPLQSWAEGLFFALIEPELYGVLGIHPPSRLQALAAQALVRGFIQAVRVLPDGPERSLVQAFGTHLDLQALQRRLGA